MKKAKKAVDNATKIPYDSGRLKRGHHMSNVDFSKGDDLSDFLGGEAPSGKTLPVRSLPTDESFARIRETVPEFTEKCPACHGTGSFKSWSGRTVGTCFKCKGKGSKTFKSAPEVRQASKQNYAQRKELNWASFTERNPEVSTWIVAQAPKFEFAQSMKNAVMTYGDLTEKQLAACQRGVVRSADYAASKTATAAVAAATPVQSYPNLKATFDALLAKGVRKAQMTAGNVNLSLASLSGRNPGSIYVKDNGEYVGKIVEGRFMGRNASPDLIARLAAIEVDPRAAVVAHAKLTADRLAAAQANGETLSLPCGCCGLTLSDPVSVARGIGPVCAAKWDF